MTQYSIRNLESLSGIKAQNIRVWERRYNLFQPQRTDTNLRLYSDEDLVKLLNIAVLIKHGNKISKLAAKDDEELKKMVHSLSYKPFLKNSEIDQLLTAVMDLDEYTFLKLYFKNRNTLGFEECVKEIIFPLLMRLGMLWRTGDIIPSQEHFASNLIRSLFLKEIASLEDPELSADSALLFLPEGEEHELSLLFYHYMAKKEGMKCIYLGTNVPYKDLKSIAESKHPKMVMTAFISSLAGRDLKSYLMKLRETFHDSLIMITGSQLKKINFQLPENMVVISSPESFHKHFPSPDVH